MTTSSAHPDFQRIFESLPVEYIIFAPDRTIVAATDAFLVSVGRRREDIVGRDVIEAFPDNPDNPDAKGTETLRKSIEHVVSTKQIEILPPVRYDIANAEGKYELRWFQPLNAPAFGKDGNVAYVLHGVEDITSKMTAQS